MCNNVQSIDERVKQLEEKASRSTSGGSSAASAKGDDTGSYFVEVKGFYNWDSGMGEKEDFELIEWLDPFFGDHTASAAFDYGLSRASAAGAWARVP